MKSPEYCPLCGRRYSVVVFNKPIDYGACLHCKTVFVKDKEGTISMLDEAIEFNPKKR